MSPGSGAPGAIVFTDIVGFTEFTATRGDADALALLDRQEELVCDALPSDARVVKELGDGLLLWLPEVVAALTVCLDLLDQFRDLAEQDEALWVRMGMHWGEPSRRGDDLVGHAVNVAARIVDVAGPGELLVSDDVRSEVAASVPGLQLDELGPVVMRGIPDPVGLYRASRMSAAASMPAVPLPTAS